VWIHRFQLQWTPFQIQFLSNKKKQQWNFPSFFFAMQNFPKFLYSCQKQKLQNKKSESIFSNLNWTSLQIFNLISQTPHKYSIEPHHHKYSSHLWNYSPTTLNLRTLTRSETTHEPSRNPLLILQSNLTRTLFSFFCFFIGIGGESENLGIFFNYFKFRVMINWY